MKHKTITTDKATLLVVELPNGKYVRCHKGYIVQSCSTELDLLNKCKRIDNGDTNGFIHIGNWQLLGSLPDITESQAHSIVDKEFNEMTDEWFYRNYSQDYDYNYTVGESLYSLLQASEVYFENPIPPFKERLDDWHEAQSKVWDKERCFLFLKIE